MDIEQEFQYKGKRYRDRYMKNIKELYKDDIKANPVVMEELSLENSSNVAGKDIIA